MRGLLSLFALLGFERGARRRRNRVARRAARRRTDGVIMTDWGSLQSMTKEVEAAAQAAMANGNKLCYVMG